MKNILTLLLSATACLVSCKKNNSETPDDVYPSVFSARHRKITSYVKVYTKSGELTDQKILSKYLEKDYEDFFRESPGLMKAEPDTIIYLSADSLKIVLDGHSSLSNIGPSNTIKPSQIFKIRKDGDYLFYSDSKYLPLLSSVADSVINKGVERFFKHKPFKLEQPPIFGMPYGSVYYYPYVAFKSGDELKFPFISLKLSQSRTVSGFISKSEVGITINNEFNESMLGTLQVGDTLAVQTSELIFERK